MIDEKELREIVTQIVETSGLDKAGFDTEEERFAFKLGAEYGLNSAIDVVMKVLKSKKVA